MIRIALLVPLLAPAAHALPQETPEVPPQARLDALIGSYDVAARFYTATDAEPLTGTGEATFEPSHGGAFVHERFSLEVGERKASGDAWIAWREAPGRYELTQVDEVNPQTLWLLGGWDDERRLLSFQDLAEARRPGAEAIRWDYRWTFDGFVKEISRADGEGGWVLASDYTYTSREVREVSRPRATHVTAPARVPMAEGLTHVLIDVKLDGKGPFRLILDTGAGTTVLDEDLVAELGLEPTGTSRIGDPSDPLANEVDVIELESVEIGGARFEGVAGVGWRGPSMAAAIGARGVLGLPTFRDCLLTIDYPRREVEVAPGELPEVDGARVLPLDDRVIAELPVDVAGRSASAHLDIGNGSSLVVPGSWIDELALKGPVRTGRGMRASGPVEFKIATLDGELRIGEHVFTDPEIRFDEMLNHVNVGHGVLSRFVLTLDQRNDRVRLEPGEAGGAAPAGARALPTAGRRRMGAALGMRSDGVAEIREVMAGTPAEEAGLREGDLLLTVDGEPVSNATLVEALSGTAPVELTVRRGEEELEVVLFDE